MATLRIKNKYGLSFNIVTGNELRLPQDRRIIFLTKEQARNFYYSFSINTHAKMMALLPGKQSSLTADQLVVAFVNGTLTVFTQSDAGRVQAECTRLRSSIRQILNEIIVQEKAEARRIDAQHQERNALEKVGAHAVAAGEGLAESAVSFLTWVKDIHDVVSISARVNRIVDAQIAAYWAVDNPWDDPKRWQATFLKKLKQAEHKELVEALGFDPMKISLDDFAKAYETAMLVYEDKKTRGILEDFVKQYAAAQHSLEIARFSGGALFEVILTAVLAAVTGGAGAAASAASKLRLANGLLKRLGDLFADLANQLKKVKIHKPVKANKDTASGGPAKFSDLEAVHEPPPATNKPPPGRNDKSDEQGHKNESGVKTKQIKENYGSNEAVWTVDETGKPISVEAKLDNTYNTSRSPTEKDLQSSVGGDKRLPDDDGGHIVGHRFMSDQGEKNLFPQNSNLNRSAYKKMENEWADWTSHDFEVKLKVKLEPPGSDRPTHVISTYEVFDPRTGNRVYKRRHKFTNSTGESFNRVAKGDMESFRE